jgi:hypothetical protein
LLRNKSSRLLPCHRGVFGVNVEPVEVCSSSVGLLDCVPAIFFNLGGQAWGASAADVRTLKGVCRAITHGKDALLCAGTRQRVFVVHWRTAKHLSARQSLDAHGKDVTPGQDLIIVTMHAPAAQTLSPLTLSLLALAPRAPLPSSAPCCHHRLAARHRCSGQLPPPPPSIPPPPSPGQLTRPARARHRRPA